MIYKEDQNISGKTLFVVNLFKFSIKYARPYW